MKMCALSGVRIVVTRAAHQAEELAVPLRRLGAEVLLVPVIAIAGPSDPRALREAAAQCDAYDWIIFTSVNAVAAFAAALPYPRPQCAARVATVGASTRQAAEQHGFQISVTPENYVAEALVEMLGSRAIAGKRILIPSAAVTRDVAAPALRRLGAQVDVIEAYRNIMPCGAAERVAEVFREPLPDWVTFASSSAVDNLVRLAGVDVLHKTRIASIGPLTSHTVRNHELSVAVEAQIHNIEGLVKAVCSMYDIHPQ